MKRLALLALPILGAALLTACGGEEALRVGDPAPEFTLNDAGGDPVTLEEYRDGGPTLLYFHMAVG